ncbi:MAG: alpha/beta fold hydrolase [Steroidobacteraceae bacterium]
MLEPPVRYYEGHGGVRLAFRELGEGRPVVLIHGFFSNGIVNWIRYGHAAALALRGHRVILPDLRAHGNSDSPADPAAYPRDVLADDGFALIRHLALDDYDLGGYSLGGRTVLRMLVRGATPRRAVVGGMGLEGMINPAARSAQFRHILTNLGTFRRGSPEWMAESFLKTMGGDPAALLRILDTAVPTAVDALTALRLPILIVAGVEDADNGSADALATALPLGRYASIDGNHMSAVTKPALGAAIGDFLQPG